MRQEQRVAQIRLRNAKVFGNAAGIDLRCPPRRALHVLSLAAGATEKARRVMVHEDAVIDGKLRLATRFHDDACRLVSEHERRLASDIPPHDVAAADAACHGANEELAVANLGNGAVLDSDVVDVIKYRRAHRSCAHGSIKTLSPSPASSFSNASAISPSG